MRLRTAWAAIALLAIAFTTARALAGPPYDTDDPDPTEYRHFEIYAGLQTHVDDGVSTTEQPFLEINYGLMRNVQFSVHLANDSQGTGAGALGYGFGDSEAGLKWRFVQETAHAPQIAFYPQLTFATGNAASGVGEGHGTLYLPVWAQKTIGKVTVFGGGGYTLDHDETGPGYWQAGVAATYPLNPVDTIGMEFTRATPHAGYQQADVGFGVTHALGDLHELLFSVGRSFDRQPHYRAYAAYGWFLGPTDKK